MIQKSTYSYPTSWRRTSITNIIEIICNIIFIFILFKYEWFDIIGSCRKRYKVYEFGFTCININFECMTNDSYILVAQCKQVFYIEDPVDTSFLVVIKTKSIDIYDVLGDVLNLDID